jgi:hypothetical protein
MSPVNPVDFVWFFSQLRDDKRPLLRQIVTGNFPTGEPGGNATCYGPGRFWLPTDPQNLYHEPTMAALSSDVLLGVSHGGLFGGDSNLRRPFGMLANYLLVEKMRGSSFLPMGSRSGSNRITRHVDAP